MTVEPCVAKKEQRLLDEAAIFLAFSPEEFTELWEENGPSNILFGLTKMETIRGYTCQL